MPKPYDRLFKTLAEEDPRGLLHLFGSLPLEVDAEVQPVEREVNLPALAVDHVYRVRTSKREWLIHYEAQTRYKADVPGRVAWYDVALALRFRVEIETVLVLLLERHAPASVPSEYVISLGGITIEVRYRVVKLWEMDPAVVLKAGRPNLMPWVTLMRTSEQALVQAAKRISQSGDRRIATEFVVLGGLRYDRSDLVQMLGRLGSMLTDEMIKESSFYQMILDEGIEKGRVDEARRNLRLVLSLRFPGLENMPELDRIVDPARLEGLLAEITTAPDAEAAQIAIRRFQT